MANWLRIILIICTLIVMIPIGILVWVASTNQGTFAAWSLIETVAPEIHVEQISGNLYEGVKFKNLRFDTPTQLLSSNYALLAIDLTAIWSGKIIIDRLELGNLRYRNSVDDSPGKASKHFLKFGKRLLLTEIAINKYSIQSFLYENTGWTTQNADGFARIYYHPGKGKWVLDSRISTGFLIGKVTGRVDVVSRGPLASITTTLTGESNAGDLQLNLMTSNLMKQLEFTLQAKLQRVQSKSLLDLNIGNYELLLNAKGKSDQITGEASLRQLNPNKEQPIDQLAFLFSADSEHLHISNLSASIRNKTVLHGELDVGVVDWTVESANIEITDLNLNDFHPNLLTTHLLGNITLQTGSKNTEVRLDLIDQNLGRLNGSIGVSPASVDVESLEFKSAAGSAELAGQVSFADDRTFALTAKAHHFNPGLFIKDLDGDLSFTLETKGTTRPLTVESLLKFNPGSQLVSEPLDGEVAFNLLQSGVTNGTGKLTWGRSTIVLHGADKSLNIRFVRINPKLLIENLSGAFSGNVRLVFKHHSTQFDLELNAAEVTFKNLLVSQIFASAQGDTSNPQNMNLKLRIESIDTNTMRARIEGLEFMGTPAQHRLRTEIIHGDTRAKISISGAYLSPVYRGELDTLAIDIAGKHQFNLSHTAIFEASPNVINLGHLILKPVQPASESAQLELKLKFDLDQYRISSRGKLNSFQLRWLENPTLDRIANGNLSAEWDLIYDNSLAPLSGRLNATIFGLDIPLVKDLTAPKLSIKNAAVLLVGNGKNATINFTVAQNDHNDFESKLSLEGLPGLKTLIKQSLPLDTINLAGPMSLKMEDLSVLSVFYPNMESKSGRIDAKIRLFGTIGKPKIDGTAHLSDFEFLLSNTELKARISQAKVLFDNQKIQLTQCDLITPATNGKATVSGNISLAPEQLGHFSLDINGATLQIMNTDRFKLTLSPDLHISGTTEKLTIQGEITVDKGLIKDLSKNQGVALSPDVVMSDSSTSTGQPQSHTIGQGIQMQIDVNIPDSFQVQYAGANILLGGKLKVLQTQAGIPIADGKLAVVDDKLVKNTYSAYGQILRIKKGSVLFARSPINDPGLNIIAVRDVRVGEVGVHVTGTVSAPEVQLESKPPMADSDILSWLVLGRPSSEAGKGFGALLLAASSEFTGSGSLIDQTRNWIGLDDLSFDSQDDTTSGMVTLGKRIGDDLYLNYKQGILQQGYKIQAIYRLSPSWSAIGESGWESNAVEIEWKKRF